MSRLIKLSDGVFVAADFVSEVKINSSNQTITVRMKDGQTHAHQPAYGSSLYRSADNLIAAINNVLAQQDRD